MRQIKRWHTLKRNKKNYRPVRSFYLDTETLQETLRDDLTEHKFLLGVGIFRDEGAGKRKSKREVYYFSDISEVWDTLESLTCKKSTLVVYAHNWKFDIHVLHRLGNLKKRGWECETHIEDEGIFISVWKKDERKIEFRDTMNYFKTTLANLGDMIGLSKIGEYHEKASREELFEYCERDAEILEKVMDKFREFLDVNDMGNMQKTISAQALSAYSHRFMQHTIEIHDHQPAIELERRAYRGGRTEAWALGNFGGDTYYRVDVNSMYPYVMASFEYPCKFLTFKENVSLSYLEKLLRDFCVIADVKIETDERVFGIKKDGKLKFPIGEFWATLSTEELKYGIKHGYITQVGNIAVYQKAFLFTHFIQEIYNLRSYYKSQGNKVFDTMLKLLMNSLYGKFGQRNHNWVQVAECDPDDFYSETILDMDTNTLNTFRYQDGIVWKSEGSIEAYNTFVAIPAHVTANARMHLWNLIKTAGESNVLYMDTDSLFLTQRGLDNLSSYLDDERLGYLKVEKQSSYLEISGVKWYNFAGEQKLKGVKKSAERVDERTFKQWTQVARNENKASEFGSRLVWINRTKELTGKDDKGVCLVNGRVMPIVLWDYQGESLIDWNEMQDRYGNDSVYNGNELLRTEPKEKGHVRKDWYNRMKKREDRRDASAGAIRGGN